MGFYINHTKKGGLPPLGKAIRLMEDEGAVLLLKAPDSFEQVEEGMVVITVVDNHGAFEAAGVLDDKREFDSWVGSEDRDDRERTYLLMDKKRAFELAGIPE